MEDINKKAQDDELNKAEEEIGERPTKFIPVPNVKKEQNNENSDDTEKA